MAGMLMAAGNYWLCFSSH